MSKVELLAPAGNLEKLKIAILYGADAVYLGGERFGLRKAAGNFSREDLIEGVKYAHNNNAKVYVTMNIIPHNEDFEGIEEYIKQIADIGIDAVLVSDPGIFNIIKKTCPELEIHLSTQANNTNYQSALFWYEQGIKRIVLARELSLKEIKEIHDKTPEYLELEAFIHGAMCISYSGRCLLSNYMTSRDSNQGDCAHPCRWKYSLVEEQRPNEYMPVYEDERGTFIFNSKDLCMIDHVPELIKAGIKSLKIEGRMKSSFYVATIVKAYRDAIDNYYNNNRFDENLLEEVKKVSNRHFTTGFFFGKPDDESQNYGSSSYIRTYNFIGVVKGYNKETNLYEIEQRNRMLKGDEIEVLSPKGSFQNERIDIMYDKNMNVIDTAPHPQMKVYMKLNGEYPINSYLRKKL